MAHPPPHGKPYGAHSPGSWQSRNHQIEQYGPPWPPRRQASPAASRKNRSGLLVGLSVTAVALLAFLITGLGAPGFLLSGNTNVRGSAQAPGNTGIGDPIASREPTGGANATGSNAPPTDFESVSVAFLDSIKAGDESAAMTLACENAHVELEEPVKTAAAQSLEYNPDGEPEITESPGMKSYIVDLAAVLDGEPVRGLLGIFEINGNSPCVIAFMPDKRVLVPGFTGGVSSEDYLHQVGDALNNGSTQALRTMICANAQEGTEEAIRKAVRGGSRFTMEEESVADYSAHAVFKYSDEKIFVFIEHSIEDESFCILRALPA